MMSCMNKRFRLLERGWIYGLVGAFLISVEICFTKHFFELLSNMEIILLTNALKFILVLAYNIAFKRTILFTETQQLPYLLVIGVVYAGSIIFWILALELLTLGSVTAIFYSSPIYTAILCRTLFSDPLGWITFLGISICVCGIGTITQPRFIFSQINNHSEPLLGYIFGLAAALCLSILYTCSRRYKDKIISRLIVTWGLISQIIISSILVIYEKKDFFNNIRHFDSLESIFVIINVFCGYIGELLIFQASQMIRASFVNSLEATSLIWLVTFGIWFYDETYNIIAFIGVAGLIIGLLIMAFEKEKIDVGNSNITAHHSRPFSSDANVVFGGDAEDCKEDEDQNTKTTILIELKDVHVSSRLP